MRTLYHPQAKFSVHFQYTSERSFSEIDTLVLQLINSNRSLSAIPDDLGLPKRIIAESAFDLLKEQMLAMTPKKLEVTPRGKRWLPNLTAYRKAQIHSGQADVFYSWNNNMTQTSFRLEHKNKNVNNYEEFFDLFQLAEPTDCKVQYGDQLFTIEDWKKITPQLERTYHSTKKHTDIFIKNAITSGLSDKGFQLHNLEQIKKPNYCYRYGYKITEIENHKSTEQANQIIELEIKRQDWLITPAEHSLWLKNALQSASNHILIFSAHENNQSLNLIESNFKETRKDSFLVLGYRAEENCYKATAKKLIHIADENSDSDIKLVVFDDKNGKVHMALGSFNWMKDYHRATSYELDEQVGYEISVVLHSDTQARTIKNILEILQAQVQDYSSTIEKSKLLQAIKNLGSSATPYKKSNDNKSLFIAGQAIATECGLALRTAQNNCLVLSHTISEALDPLQPLVERATPLASSCIVAFSDLYPSQPSHYRNRASKEQIDCYIKRYSKNHIGKIIHLPGVHSRVIINDDIITVSSLNCLSAFRAQKSAFGIRFKDPNSSQFLLSIFEDYCIPQNEQCISTTPMESLLSVVDSTTENNIEKSLTSEEQELLRQLLEKARSHCEN